MSAPAFEIPRRCLAGRQYIIQRLDACRCGCKGSDSWHAASTRRVVRNVVQLDTVEKRRSLGADGFSRDVVALGEYAHPSGTRACGLTVHVGSDGSVSVLGWHRIETEEERAERLAKRAAERAETDAFFDDLASHLGKYAARVDGEG